MLIRVFVAPEAELTPMIMIIGAEGYLHKKYSSPERDSVHHGSFPYAFGNSPEGGKEEKIIEAYAHPYS